MRGINVISTGMALPAGVLSNDDLTKTMDTSDEWIYTRTGIKSRRVCLGTDETCNSLAKDAAEMALKRAKNICPDIEEKLGVLIVCSLTPDNAIPSTACLVKEELNLHDEIMAFDMNAACSGFLYGIQVAHGLLGDMSGKYAMVIGCEQLSRVMDYSNEGRGTSILFGDGAGSIIFGLSENEDDFYFAKSWAHGDKEALYCDGVGKTPAFVRMDGQKVFKFATRVFEQGIDEMLSVSGLTLSDVDVIVGHQANLRILNHIIKKHAEHEHKFYIDIEDHGNTSAASVAIALNEVYENGTLKKGMTVLLVAFGAGLTWSAAMFTA